MHLVNWKIPNAENKEYYYCVKQTDAKATLKTKNLKISLTHHEYKEHK